ncbi:MAG: hypothetical protein ABFC62_05715 [Clostridiaceae bacterium]
MDSENEKTVLPGKLLPFEKDLPVKLGASKIKTIPYSLKPEAIEKAFENFLMQGDDAPVDIVWRSRNHQIQSILYPVRCFHVTYAADWSATSIWQHDEPYTVYEPKTIYLDFLGREHDSQGFDAFENGRYRFTERGESRGSMLLTAATGAELRPFTPQQRMEPVTRYNQITDDIEQTSGSIQDQSSFEPVITYDGPQQKEFAGWVLKTPVQKLYAKSTDANDVLTNCFVMPLAKTNQAAQSIAASSIKKIAAEKCKESVPGNLMEDFHIELKADYDMEVLMVPLYRVVYHDQGQEFECWFRGWESSAPFYQTKPRDETLKLQVQKAAETSSEFEAYRKKTGKRMGLFMAATLVFWAAGSLIFLSAVPTYIMVGLMAAWFVWVFKFKAEAEKNKQTQTLKKEESLSGFKKAREDILALTKRSDLSEPEKERKVQTILDTVTGKGE